MMLVGMREEEDGSSMEEGEMAATHGFYLLALIP